MSILKSLINTIGHIMIVSFIMQKIAIFKKIFLKENIDLNGKIFLGITFGIYGIIGTYTGITINGEFLNSGVIGVFVGGLIGGPFVGILAGLITGVYRYSIDIEGFTALAYMISALIQGILGGVLRSRAERSDNRMLFVLNTGIIVETIRMIIVLLMARPFSDAFSLVKVTAIPMVLINGLGISIFIVLIDSIFREVEVTSSYRIHLSLKIANKTLKYLRKGLNEETALETAKILKDMTRFKAIALTDREKTLAYVGLGEDHNLNKENIMTHITKEVIKDGKLKTENIKKEIDCSNINYKLKLAIIAPLMENGKVIGTLKLYRDKESIALIERNFIEGLVLLFSTQLELSKIDKQSELITKSELKALQAQINPHFLFNAINTIVSLIRTRPEKARGLLIHLGDYFRNNLQEISEFVSLQKEIENINSYLEIEKARFGEKLNIIYNIDDEVECSLYPLLLQPIVENAIKHGVLEKLKGGTVEISARNTPTETILTVKDDGVGMDENTKKMLFIEREGNESIGLLNVENRLKNRYGEDYGLKIQSSLDKGTTVIMRIPKAIAGGVI